MPDLLTPESTDGELIDAVLSGRRSAFTLLAQRYQRSLYATALSRLGQPPAAEDAVQETLFSAFKSLSTYQAKYSFRTWLWTILLNQCRRQLARRTRTPRVFNWSDQARDAESADPDLRVSAEPGPQQQTGLRDQSEWLMHLLQQLPEDQADALRFRFYGRMKFQEIADAMQCSLTTAKNRVRWGLTSLSRMAQRDPAASANVFDLESH
jgi:RNA polymerase sigma-70 factor (ECF subfamily)